MKNNVSQSISDVIKNIPADKVELVTLSDKQKADVLKHYKENYENPPSLKDLIDIAWPDMNFDGRDKPGMAVRKFLKTLGIKPKTNAHIPVGKYDLSMAEQEFIQNNAASGMKIMEMAKTLFNPKITSLSKEVRAMREFVTKNQIPFLEEEAEQTTEDRFDPPKSYAPCLRLVNKYTHDIINSIAPSEREKQGINALVRFLHTPRFVQMINNYTNKDSRELFLSEFIRACYNKSDLTSDEINLYLNLCSDIVLASGIQKQIEVLSNRLNDIAEDPEGKITLPLAQAITAKTNEFDKCLTRQKQLIGDLNGNRAKRLEKQQSAGQNLFSLVAFWQEKKGREKFLKLAKMKQEALAGVVRDLENMDSIKAEIWGSL